MTTEGKAPDHDLEQWLKGEPIHARSVSRLERAWRRCKRNPLVSSRLAFSGWYRSVEIVDASPRE
jgi:ferric-dicitrate binding protein FerR (iron transport regulator)